MAVLIQAITKDSTTIKLTELEAGFPKDNGMIQIGAELISYETSYMGTFEKCTRGVNSTTRTAHDAQELVLNATGTVDKCKSKLRSITVYLTSEVQLAKMSDYKKALHKMHIYSKDWDEIKDKNGKIVAITVLVKTSQLTEAMSAISGIIEGVNIVMGDAVEPVCVITAPAHLAQISGVVTLEATAEKKATKVVYKQGELTIGFSTIFPYAVEYDVSALPAGNLDIIAYAYDKKNKLLGRSAPITLLIASNETIIEADGTEASWNVLLADPNISMYPDATGVPTMTFDNGVQTITFNETNQAGFWQFGHDLRTPLLPERTAYAEAKLAFTAEAIGVSPVGRPLFNLQIGNGSAWADMFICDNGDLWCQAFSNMVDLTGVLNNELLLTTNLAIDLTQMHTFRLELTSTEIIFSVDGVVVVTTASGSEIPNQVPDYNFLCLQWLPTILNVPACHLDYAEFSTI